MSALPGLRAIGGTLDYFSTKLKVLAMYGLFDPIRMPGDLSILLSLSGSLQGNLIPGDIT